MKSSRFCGFCINALWKLREFSLTPYCQNSRESNSFTIWITKELIWRNSSLVREKFPKCGIAHWCRQRITQCRNCDNLLHNFLPKLPWNQCIYYFILYSVFTNFFLEWNSEISTLWSQDFHPFSLITDPLGYDWLHHRPHQPLLLHHNLTCTILMESPPISKKLFPKLGFSVHPRTWATEFRSNLALSKWSEETYPKMSSSPKLKVDFLLSSYLNVWWVRTFSEVT